MIEDDDLRGIEEALGHLLSLGFVEVSGLNGDGEPLYGLTEKGEKYIDSHPDAIKRLSREREEKLFDRDKLIDELDNIGEDEDESE